MPLKKILFLSPWYPNKQDPTFGIFVQRHAKAAAINHQVITLYACAHEGKTEIVEKKEGNLYQVWVYHKQGKFNKFSALRQGYSKIIAQYGKLDLVHLNIAFPIGLFALYLKLPFLLTEHWTGYHSSDGSYKGFLRKFITKKVMLKAKAFLPVSEDLKSAMEKHRLHNANTHIIPNVVDVNLFQPAQKANPKRFIHISSMEDAQKNVSGILNTVKKIAEKRNDFEVHMIGEGKDFTTLKEQAKNLPIIFHGTLLNSALANLLASGTALILFSNYENLPCVIPEALACGVPVISTNVGGIAEHLNDQNGILIDAGNESQLEKAMLSILDEEKYFDGEILRNYSLTHFSEEAIGKQFSNIYDSLIK